MKVSNGESGSQNLRAGKPSGEEEVKGLALGKKTSSQERPRKV